MRDPSHCHAEATTMNLRKYIKWPASSGVLAVRCRPPLVWSALQSHWLGKGTPNSVVSLQACNMSYLYTCSNSASLVLLVGWFCTLVHSVWVWQCNRRQTRGPNGQFTYITYGQQKVIWLSTPFGVEQHVLSFCTVILSWSKNSW